MKSKNLNTFLSTILDKNLTKVYFKKMSNKKRILKMILTIRAELMVVMITAIQIAIIERMKI